MQIGFIVLLDCEADAGLMTTSSVIKFLKIRLQHVLNFGSFFVARFLSLSLFAGSVAYYINHVGAQAYGILTLLLLVFSYLHIFDMGMGYAVNIRFTRRLARGHSNAEDIIRKAIPFYITATLIIFAALFSGASLVSQLLFKTTDHLVEIRWLSVAILFLMPSALCTSILQAYNRVYLINMSRVLLDVVRAGAMLTAAMLGKSLTFIVIFMATGSFLKLLVDVFLTTRIIKSYSWFRPIFSWQDLKLNASFGFPVMASVCIGMIFNSADKLFFARLFPQQLPFYSVAFDINTKAYFLIWAITGSLYNVFLRRHASGQSRDHLIKLSFIGAAAIALLYYFPVTIFAKKIISLWINPAFAQQTYMFVRLMAIPSVLYLFMSVLYSLTQSEGRAKDVFFSDLVALLAFLSTLIIFKSIGPPVVIAGFTIAFIMQISFLFFRLWRSRKRRIISEFL